MEFPKKIPPNIYVLVSRILITTAILILFLGKFILATPSLIFGIISFVTWTFFGLFEDT